MSAIAGPFRRFGGWLTRMPLLANVAVMLVVAGLVTFGSVGLVGANFGAGQSGLEQLKVALMITGGIGGVVALVVAYRRQRLGEAAEEREEGRLFNERFATASTLLGSDHAASRLAGVYAMASLADDWDAERQTCINVLCAYIRMPYEPPRQRAPVDVSAEQHRKDYREARQERNIRRAVMNSIGSRLRKTPEAGKTWHGHDFFFSGAVIDGGNLTSARFTGGRVSFDRATFAGGAASFDRAEFTGGRVSFDRAEFAEGRVSFEGASFIDGRVTFVVSKIASGTFSMLGARFTGGEVNFGGARITGGAVFFIGAEFSGGTVSFERVKAVGGRISFSDAEFSGSEVSFLGAEFAGGIIELRSPLSYDVPPVFDKFPGGPPVGILKLPDPPKQA
ncbi:MAG: pentapeptide repeat-containing protein [Stackebrandtia sp.]